MRLSIIVPVYNVEDYIEKCILSLEAQDIPTTDYEIIIVNDGSPDNSREVILNLIKQFDNIVFIDQENQGVSMARNNAIACSRGDYILSIDPDDYVISNSLKRIIAKAYENNLDVLYLGFEILDINGKVIWKTKYGNKEGNKFFGVDAYFAARGNDVRDPDRSWAILFKKSLLKEFEINYPKDVPYLEDGLFIAKVFCKAQRCGFDSAFFYQRTTRLGSATNSTLIFTDKALKGFILAADDLRIYSKKNNVTEKQKGLVNHVIAKFVLLPVTACVVDFNWIAYKNIKQIIVKNGFNQLELNGCRFDFYKYAYHFNKSKDWFFIYYLYQLKLKFIKHQINRVKNLFKISML